MRHLSGQGTGHVMSTSTAMTRHDHDHDHAMTTNMHHDHGMSATTITATPRPGTSRRSSTALHLPRMRSKDAAPEAVYDADRPGGGQGPRLPGGRRPLPRGGGSGRGGRRHRRVLRPASASAGTGCGLPHPCGQRHGALRPRRDAGARPRHGEPADGRAHLWRRGPGGAVHPHRGGPADPLCRCPSAPCR